MNERYVPRREFIRSSVAMVALLPAALAACGAASVSGVASSATAGAASSSPARAASSSPARAASNNVKLPSYAPLTTLHPDSPGSADGLIDQGYLAYPKQLVKSVPNPPGKGGDVDIFTWTFNSPPPPVDQNTLWQAVNKDIGANLRFNVVPLADYPTKIATIAAGADLPDVIFVNSISSLGQLPDFLASKCADLTPYLAGDAVKDFPNLANFPTQAWRNTIFNGKIYAIPDPYPLYFWVHWVHQELLDQAGISAPQNADDYKKALQELTKPQSNVWGLGAAAGTEAYGLANGHFPSMFGAPNTWSVDTSGKMTHVFETDQFRAAVSYTRDLYAAGVFHPNSATYNTVSKRSDFQAGRFVYSFDGFQASSTTFWDAAPNLKPPGKFRVAQPFNAQPGGKPVYWGGTGSFGLTVLKQATPDRIKELLGILNYIAAPFGTQEYQLMRYGVKGVNYAPDEKGAPVLTAKGKADATVPWTTVTMPPWAMFSPKWDDYVPTLQGIEKMLRPYITFDPTIGLYSATYAAKVGLLQQKMVDGLNQIVRGGPLSDLDGLISSFRAAGGDQARMEFQQALSASAS